MLETLDRIPKPASKFCVAALFNGTQFPKRTVGTKNRKPKPSRLNYLDRDPISFVGGPWRATADLVRGRVVTILYRSLHRGGISTTFLARCPCSEKLPRERKIYPMKSYLPVKSLSPTGATVSLSKRFSES